MRLITAEEYRRIIAYTTGQMEIPLLLLAENASGAVVRAIDLEKRHSFAVFCGPTFNGAIGLAVARRLLGLGKQVGVYLLDPPEEPDAAWQTNVRAVQHLTRDLHSLETLGDLDDMLQALGQYNTIIDGLYGSELDFELKGVAPIVIDNINQSRTFTISIDVPSGLDATTGRPYGAFIEAGMTISLGFMKKGLMSNRLVDGPVHVVDIGIPKLALTRALREF